MRIHNSKIRYLLIFFIVTIVLINAQQADSDPKQHTGSQVHQDLTLPSSLDNLFPPTVAVPVFQHMMLGMSMALSGTLVDLFENDMENALGNFEKFKKLYSEIPKAVPEWLMHFPVNRFLN